MRSLLKMAILFIALFASNSTFANTDKPLFKIKNFGEKTFYLETFEMASSFVEITIQNKKGEKLFSEYAIHVADFERKYNLSELVNGTYYVVVKSDTITQVLPLTLTDSGLKIDFEELETM